MSITAERILTRLIEDATIFVTAATENPQSSLTEILKSRLVKTINEASDYQAAPKKTRATDNGQQDLLG